MNGIRNSADTGHVDLQFAADRGHAFNAILPCKPRLISVLLNDVSHFPKKAQYILSSQPRVDAKDDQIEPISLGNPKECGWETLVKGDVSFPRRIVFPKAADDTVPRFGPALILWANYQNLGIFYQFAHGAPPTSTVSELFSFVQSEQPGL